MSCPSPLRTGISGHPGRPGCWYTVYGTHSSPTAFSGRRLPQSEHFLSARNDATPSKQWVSVGRARTVSVEPPLRFSCCIWVCLKLTAHHHCLVLCSIQDCRRHLLWADVPGNQFTPFPERTNQSQSESDITLVRMKHTSSPLRLT